MRKVRFDLKYENKSESSVSVVERYRLGIENDDWDNSLALVHYRGGEEEFQLGKRYLESDDPLDRAVGADILGQLGWRDETFLTESVTLLISTLDDEVENVVYCACVALGHRGDERAIEHVIQLTQSTSTEIKSGVVFALLGHESSEAIDALIVLSRDPDFDTRNWAMFGLGTQIEVDTPQIRQALLVGAVDDDCEVRGEAFVGLANRKDHSVVELLLNEWRAFDDVNRLSLDAAEIIASPRLYSSLLSLQQTLDLEDDVYFEKQLQGAIDACKPKTLQVVASSGLQH